MPKSDRISYSLVPYAPLVIDSGLGHVLNGMAGCLRLSGDNDNERRRLCHEIGSFFCTASNHGNTVVCLSVRTAFDLFLRTKRFPVGSEVIMSAINIPGMADIVRENGLVPVPWDLDAGTLSPKMELLDRLINDHTVAILVAHLYGKRCSIIDETVRIARKRGLYFLEDCAEAFDIFQYLGHPQADLVFFSFGTLKTCTAFGGAVCIIHDSNLHHQMQTLYDSDPIQSRYAYFKKLFTILIAYFALDVPLMMKLGVPFLRLINVDYRTTFVELLRGFPPGPDLWNRIRQQPSMPLLILLVERLRNASMDDMRRAMEKYNFARRLLPENRVAVAGHFATHGNYWLFPIVVENPELVASQLNAMGIEAFTKATQLSVVSSGRNGTNGIEAPEATEMMNHMVYLPIHKGVPHHYIRRICKAVHVAVTSQPQVVSSNGDKILYRSKL